MKNYEQPLNWINNLAIRELIPGSGSFEERLAAAAGDPVDTGTPHDGAIVSFDSG